MYINIYIFQIYPHEWPTFLSARKIKKLRTSKIKSVSILIRQNAAIKLRIFQVLYFPFDFIQLIDNHYFQLKGISHIQ